MSFDMGVAIQDRSERTDPVNNNSLATFERLLLVLEQIAVCGPVTLNDLTERVPFSRGAIWRATQALRRRGWVRIRRGDNAFEISHQIDEFFSTAHVALPECEEFELILAEIEERKFVHVAIGIFLHHGEFCYVDSTYKNAVFDDPRSLVFDAAALAALSGCSKPEQVRHLNAFLETAQDDERVAIMGGDHVRRLAAIDPHDLFWSETKDSFSVGLNFQTGMRGAVSFFPRDGAGRGFKQVKTLASAFEAFKNTRALNGTCSGVLDVLTSLQPRPAMATEGSKSGSV